VYPHADYVTVNISSPNTQNLRALQSDAALDGLLGAIAEHREQLAADLARREAEAAEQARQAAADAAKPRHEKVFFWKIR